MSPLKLVILAILFYVGYRLITGGNKKKSKQEEAKIEKEAEKNSASITDVLVEDPVCHTLVPKQQAIHYKHQGQMLYFCSEKCCNVFVTNKGEKE